ncbi:MAG: hypothetical protein JNM93_12385 [Bacteriovoracaceae bacterium]|nr:hypothetical protein [Bacteriovoracaceae bacterium]
MKNKNDTPNGLLSSKVNLSKIPSGEARFKLNKTHPWVKELLIELNEKVTDLSEEEKLERTELNIDFEIEKKHKTEYGDFVLVMAEINGRFLTECVKTLKTMEDMLHVKFQACFVAETFSESELLLDQTEIYINNDLYELYFYQDNEVDIKEMFHEQIFLNITAYPTLEADGPLN